MTILENLTFLDPDFRHFTFLNRNYWESTLTAEQTLYDFGATPSRYNKAVIGKEVAQMETRQAKMIFSSWSPKPIFRCYAPKS